MSKSNWNNIGEADTISMEISVFLKRFLAKFLLAGLSALQMKLNAADKMNMM
ncbi:Uncharacterised protein [uncultured archaeon]|nr:Uncharacterised protein [uncultured archaeon]